MQRQLSKAARVSIASFVLGVAACASEVMPDVGGSIPGGGGSGGAGSGGTSGGAAAGKGGMVGGAGTTNNQAGLGGNSAGAGNGGAGAVPPIGGQGGDGVTGGAAGNGGTSGAGGAAGSGGLGGVGGGTGGAGGKAGAGGAAGTGGAAGAGGGGAGSVNLIDNAGFETNTSGWSVFGGGATISTATAQSHSGTRSLMITGRTQAYQGPQYSVLGVVTPGTSYTLSVWGRLSGTTPTGSLTVTVYYACSGGTSDADNYFRWVETTEASASSWTHLMAARVFPTCAGAGTMTAASFYVESPSATLAYYIDDVVLTTP